MNGVVVEIRKKRCVVLSESGDFLTMENKNYEIGESVEILTPRTSNLRLAPIISIAASLIVFLSVGGYAFFRPFGVVSVDVNPSIEFTINCFDLVLKAKGVNDDGAAILETIDSDDYLYKPVNTAVSSAIGSLRENNYFNSESENYVVVAANTKKEDTTQTLVNEISDSINSEEDLTPITIAASTEETKKAHDLGTTAGKLNIIDELGSVMDESEEFNESDWIDSSVAEIMKEIDLHKNRKFEDREPADTPAEKIPEEDLTIDISGNDDAGGDDHYILPVEPDPPLETEGSKEQEPSGAPENVPDMNPSEGQTDHNQNEAKGQGQMQGDNPQGGGMEMPPLNNR